MNKIYIIYYKCDYCGIKHSTYSEFKYNDNSGILGKSFDMCSEECYKKHIDFLTTLYKNVNLHKYYDFDFSDGLEDHIKNWIEKR